MPGIMDFPSLPGADESLPLNENNDTALWESSDDSDIEVIKELKTTLVAHECDLCCEGEFLVNRLLQFGGVLNKDMKFACEICDKGFKVKSGLAKHMKQHLKSNEKNGGTPRKASIEQSNSLNNSSALNSSNRSDSFNTPSATLSCSFCPKSYKTKYSLQRHMRKNHSNQPYVCEVCKAKFSDFSQFTNHCSSHSASLKNKYSCEDCSQQFSLKKELERHVCTSTA